MSLAPDASSSALGLVAGLQFEPAPGGYGQPRSWQWQLDSGALPHDRVFDLYGRMVRYPLGGAVRDITYDAAGRISSYVHYSAVTGTPVASLDQSFGYDALSRLTSVSTSVGSWTYAYDDNGNRTAVSTNTGAGSSTRTYTTAANSNRLLALDNPVRTLAQDEAGNTYSDVQGSIGWTATHDLAGRLVGLSSSPDGSSAYVTQYSYNALGQRVLVRPISASCIGAVRACAAAINRRGTVVYVYDQQGMLLGEYGGDGTPLREYVWLQGMPLAVVEGAAVSPAIYYVHADHLDTPRTVIDRAGRQRWSWLAEPFGNSAPLTNPLGFGSFNLRLRMPGQYADVESGLSYNYFRTYDAPRALPLVR
jgi:YD repeat-containing protein